MSEPITREEMYLAALVGDAVTLPDPLTREELYLAYLNGMTDTYPDPITRTEQYLYTLCQNGMGSGGGVTIRNQNKTITENGSYKADSGYTGLGTVTVNVPQEEPVLQDKTATKNGNYTADSGFDGLGTVTVAVPEPVLQNKTVTENGTVTADSGYDGLGVVTVNVAASGGGDDVARAIVDRSITEYSDDKVTAIGNNAFQNCASLKSINAPNVTRIGVSSFDTTGLENCDFPNVISSGNNAFRNCKSLKTAYMPKLESVTGGMFAGCSLLEEVDFSSVKGTGSSGLSNCPLLKKVDFPNANQLSASMFTNNTAMETLVLRTNNVCNLINTNVFDGTPFASGGTGGTVYCPASLITQYQQATNWATLYAAGTCNFVAIEGSEYE